MGHLLVVLQFLGILAAILLLQITAGVVGYLSTDMVRPHCCDETGNMKETYTHHFLHSGDLFGILKLKCQTKAKPDATVVQVMERTEKLMMKAIVRYREDPDLENAIDFVQKKVKKKNDSVPERQRQFVGSEPLLLTV